MRFLAFLIACFLALPVTAQNLIPNGGFEEFKRCPKGLGQIDRATGWSSPNGGTPDYFNKCYTKDIETVGVPNNFFGTRDAYDGEAYAGILHGDKEKEYLQIPLAEQLVAGRRYCLRFRVAAPSPRSDGVFAIRACFLDTTLALKTWDALDTTGWHMLETNWMGGSDAGGWALFSKTFTATGIEKVLLVGHFEALPGRAYSFLDAFELNESTSEQGCDGRIFMVADDDSTNLIRNPGFEEMYDCPNKREELHKATAWQVLQNSPDFYHVCGTGTAAVPRNELGNQSPRSGNGYGGIWAMLQERQNYREFVAARIKRPLVPGKRYCLSIWVSLAEVSDFALDQLQLLITRDDEDRHSCQVGVDTSRLVTLQNGQLLDDAKSWTLLHGIFIAQGGEQGIAIGNFRENDDPHMHRLEDPPAGGGNRSYCSYYYIDELGLHEVGAPGCPCPGLADTVPAVVVMDTVPVVEPEFEVGDTLVLRNLQFAFDKAELLPGANKTLDSLADYLLRHGDLRIRITGHTDSDGAEDYNLRLSRDRAASVLAYLSGRGISGDRMESAGMGEGRPCVPNDSDAAKALNRRVEVEFR